MYFLSFTICCLWLPICTFGHCIFCPLRYTASGYTFVSSVIVLSVLYDILLLVTHLSLWSLYFLSFTIYCFWLHICLFGHCIFCPLRYTASGYTFVSLVIVFSVLYDILLLVTHLSLWSLYFLSFTIYGFWLHICLFGHCIFCPLRYTASGYTFVSLVIVFSVLYDILLLVTHLSLWSLYFLSFSIYCFWLHICLFGHCIFCPLRYTASGYTFVSLVIVFSVLYDILLLVTHLSLWSLYFLSFTIYCFWLHICLFLIVFSVLYDILLLVTHLSLWSLYFLSFTIYGFWLHICLFGHCIFCPLRYTASGYPFVSLVIVFSVLFDILLLVTHLSLWSLYFLSFTIYCFWLHICLFGHCIFCPLRYTASGYTFVSLVIVFSVLYDILLLVTHLSLSHCIFCPLRYTASGYTFVSLVIVFSVLYDIRLLVTHLSLWSLYNLSFTIYCFWLHICLFGHCIFCPLRYTASGYTFVSLVIVFSVLFDIRLLVTHLSLRSLYFLSFTIYCFWLPICLFGHCIFCPLRYTASGYTFVSLVIVFSVLYDIRLLVTHLSLWSLYFLSFTIYCFWLYFCLFCHCIFCPLRYTASGYTFVSLVIVFSVLYDILLLVTHLSLWSLYFLSFTIYGFWLHICLFGHCIFCPLRYTASGYTFVSLVIVFSVLHDILLLVTHLSLWSLYFLSFTIYCFWLHICLFGHCIFCPLRYTASGYPFVSLVIVFSVLYDILLLVTHLSLWSLYFLSFTIYGFWLHICLFGHCIFCPLRYTASGYTFVSFVIVFSVLYDILLLVTHLSLWSLYFLSFTIYCFWLHICLFGHCIFCPLRYTASGYTFVSLVIVFSVL